MAADHRSGAVATPDHVGPEHQPSPAAQRAREHFRSSEAASLLGLSRRQLLYWAQTGLVRPSHTTPGGHLRYGFRDLVALKAAKRLIDAGISVQRIRSSLRALELALPHVRSPLAELVLVATGDVVLAIHRGEAFEALSGQEWVLDVAEFQREFDHWRASHAAERSCN